MAQADNYKKLKKFCLNWGADLFGVADVTAIKDTFALKPQAAVNLNRALCLGVRISSSILEEIQDQPTKLYFHHYRVVNMFLDQLALRVSNFIQGLGYRALPVGASQILDWQKQSAHLSHKKIGVLAGLGWIGRNNLLVNKKFGSQFRLVSILTDLPLKADKPVKEGCGKCLLCMVICPAKAIKESPADFGHQECFSMLKEFQRQRIVDQYVCGVCLKACKGKDAKG